jgi:hypothetical protein
VLVLSGATPGTEIPEALLQKFLQLRTGATLKQHVPVAAWDFGVGVVDLDRFVVHEEPGLVAAVTTLPTIGSLGVGGKNDIGLLAARRALVGVTGTRRVNDAFFALQALGAKPHSAQTAISH